MQPNQAETNPYQTPGIERLHHTSIYQWPLPPDKLISFEINIDREQLLKCVSENDRLVASNILVVLFLAISFLISCIIVLSGATGPISLFFCVCTFIGLCFLAPRCSYAWHARRLHQQLAWLFGKVQVTINGEGVHWKNESVEFHSHWDSFHRLAWWNNCLWLSTNHPFAMEIPVHRVWVDESTWGDLRQVAGAHKGFFDKQVFWKLANPSLVLFHGAAAPDLAEVPLGAIPFRSHSLGGSYGSEISAYLIQNGSRMIVLPFMLVSIGLLTPYARELDQMLGITKNGYHMYLFYAVLIISNSYATVIKWLPAGPGFFQWSQTLLSSQSGYISPDCVRIDSPACSITAKLGGEIKLQRYRDCLVLKLQRKFAQSLVIPRDQFAPETAV